MSSRRNPPGKSPGTEHGKKSGITRRTFMKSWPAGTIALAVGPGIAAQQNETVDQTVAAGDPVPLTLNVNGKAYSVLAEPRWTLLHVLREELGLTAAKIGCQRGECGSCTVLIDDKPRYACMTLALEAENVRIETAEGLVQGSEASPLQLSFMKEDGLQCGYCTPGQIMAAEGLLRANPHPDFDEIRRGLSGNLCRCGAYTNIFNAVADAAQRRKE